MITTLLALSVLRSSPAQEPAAPSAVSVLQRMFQRYAAAKTLVGTIRFTQAANRVSLVTDTQLQFERPSKLFLRQTRTGGSEDRMWLVTSDGVRFTYNKPESAPGKDVRLMEAVVRKGGLPPNNISDMFYAAGDSLGDKGPIISAVLGDNVQLKNLLAQWAGFKYAGKVMAKGGEAHLIKGRWRPNAVSAPSAEFEMFITDAGDFLRYAQRETVTPPPSAKAPPIVVISVWEADLRVDVPVEPSLFRVVL